MLEITQRAGTIQALINPLYALPLTGKASRVRTRMLKDMEVHMNNSVDLAKEVQERNGTSLDENGNPVGKNAEKTIKEIQELSDDKYPVEEPMVDGFKDLYDAIEDITVTPTWATSYDELMTALEGVIPSDEPID